MLMWDVKHIILQDQKDEYVKLGFLFLFLLFHLLYRELTKDWTCIGQYYYFICLNFNRNYIGHKIC
jgi:hypothetical protein